MANTTALQDAFEWVRGELGRRYGVTFAKTPVPLLPGGSRTFNAVAADRSVVATIVNSSGLTASGKKPVGKLRGAEAELYFLSLVEAPHRLLVTTDGEFHALLSRDLEGALAPGLELLHVQLPDDLAMSVKRITSTASQEMSG